MTGHADVSAAADGTTSSIQHGFYVSIAPVGL